MTENEGFMKEAIRQAKKAEKLNEVPIGCVIVYDGTIVQARIPKVVIGTMNSKAGCAGSVINVLQMKEFNHQVDICKGVLADECKEMMQNFFKNLREKKKMENY